MSLEIVEYLKTNSVKSLEANGIYARWSTKNPKKLSLNYDQIEAKDSDVLTQHCRGLVLEQKSGLPGESGEYSVLARPFYRFFNFGQEAAKEIDWESARFEEKLDGTLCIVYFDNVLNEWCVATRSVPDADIENHNGFTFADLFWKHSGVNNEILNRQYTYLFELCGPENQIVVPYNDWSTTNLAVFDNGTCQEVDLPDFEKPKTYPLSEFKSAIQWINEQPGIFFEGCVVVDKYKNRVKIKNNQYLAASRVLSSAQSDEGLLELILEESLDDAAPYMPKPKLEKAEFFKESLKKIGKEIDEFAAELKSKETRKDAAIATQANKSVSDSIGCVLDIWSGKIPSFMAHLKAHRQHNGCYKDSFLEFLVKKINKYKE